MNRQALHRNRLDRFLRLRRIKVQIYIQRSQYLRQNSLQKITLRWDWLPKFIVKELAPDTTEAEFRCQACGRRLLDLFGRAVKGMVDRTVLRALVNEICNEELYRNIPKPEIVEYKFEL